MCRLPVSSCWTARRTHPGRCGTAGRCRGGRFETVSPGLCGPHPGPGSRCCTPSVNRTGDRFVIELQYRHLDTQGWFLHQSLGQLARKALNLPPKIDTKRYSVRSNEMMSNAPTNAFCQTLQVRATSDTQTIQSSDWLKRCWILWHNVIFCLFSDITSFQMVRKLECRYLDTLN